LFKFEIRRFAVIQDGPKLDYFNVPNSCIITQKGDPYTKKTFGSLSGAKEALRNALYKCSTYLLT